MSKPWIETYGDSIPVEVNPDQYPSAVAILKHAASEFGDHVALECFGQTMTYKQVDEASDAVAAYLQKELGVKRGDRIALMCPNTFAFPVVMVGIHKAGACQVNVNPLYTPHELSHQLNDSGSEMILIFSGSTPVLAEIIDETPIKTVITINLGDGAGLPIPSPEVDSRLTDTTGLAEVITRGRELTLDPVELTGDDLIFLQYTGGTTGLSKGATLTHRNIVANSEQFKAMLPGATEPGEEVVIMALPLYHIFGLMLLVAYAALGARIVLIPNPRDMDGMIDTIKGSKFTIFPGVNTLFQALSASPRFGEIDLSAYKLAIGGGAAVIEATSNRWKELTGHHIKEGYGLSETSPLLCINPMNVTHFTGTCGVPVPSSEVILLGDDDKEVGPGESGEICCRGPQVTQGYWEKPEANAASFTKDGFFRTGDVGVFLEGGFLKIVDRKKDMVIVSGFNVFPNEIEATVTACEGVAECACIGVPDERTGEALRVFVVKMPGSDVTSDAIVAHCRNNLTAYKVPKQIVFLDALPKSNVGKILRRELRDQN
ncbi:AMP-binding protein [Palleronia caenipelagi]|uniref:Long-chain-fatty-acid--CoA ligase n=1 Tax=Palleronia caenipelagi TaxID=2489174 RepID=A0A547Q2Y6_9RHOB|nr:AMP-binding protein [Palleronia caenipelagi]TRD20698.1 AMP-binding protein [Palleronia caenipelagi]